MISKLLQILGFQPRVSKVFLDHYNNFFSQYIGQNNFGNKIVIPFIITPFSKNQLYGTPLFLIFCYFFIKFFKPLFIRCHRTEWCSCLYLITCFIKQKITQNWSNLTFFETFGYKHFQKHFQSCYICDPNWQVMECA